MNKKLIFVIFGLIILAVPLFVILSSEDVLSNGHRHKIRLRGYDPFDPFRGKYLRLNYDNMIPCDENLQAGDEAYVTLKKDSAGYSVFDYASAVKPSHDDYITCELSYVGGGEASFEADNMSKYFINEDKAFKAESLMMEYTRDKPDQIYVAIRVLDGDARLEDIFIEEIPLLEFLDR